MDLRYILLRAEYGSYDDAFFHVFMDNVRFISNYMSRRIRSYHIKTDGTFNMISVSLTASSDSCKLESENVLAVRIHFDEESMNRYKKMKDEKIRFEFYLSMLEQGYSIASQYKDIPYKTLCDLHQEFRLRGYQNKYLFKTKRLRNYGISIKLFHVLSSYDYRLMLYIYTKKNNLIGEGPIYITFPDEILFSKNVRHLVIEDGKLIIADFLNHPQFVCSLDDLCKGIVKSVCVDEKTQMYIPNKENVEKFKRLKWK